MELTVMDWVSRDALGYGYLLDFYRRGARVCWLDEAAAMGADAVINVRFGSSAVMQGAAEVIAYGTAVKLK